MKFTDLKCINCERHPPDVNLHRINRKGVPGQYLCDDCHGLPKVSEEEAIVRGILGPEQAK